MVTFTPNRVRKNQNMVFNATKKVCLNCAMWEKGEEQRKLASPWGGKEWNLNRDLRVST